SAGGWVRYPDSPGVVGAFGREHDDDLHPCLEPGSYGGSEPGGPAVRGGWATVYFRGPCSILLGQHFNPGRAKMMRGGGFRLPGGAVACCVLLDIKAGIGGTGSSRMQVK